VWVCPQVRHSAERFLVCQVGLSCFRLLTDKWVSKTYNFTIFPRTFGDEKKLFTCDVGSLGFLAEHNFDFNKMIHQGIPFMPLEQKERLLKVRLLVLESMLKALLKRIAILFRTLLMVTLPLFLKTRLVCQWLHITRYEHAQLFRDLHPRWYDN
jgi:hypothetical protein